MIENPTPEERAAGHALDGWLTRKQLAEELGLSIDTLQTWASEGRGPVFVRIGLKTYYRLESVRDWLLNLEAEKLRRVGKL